MLLTEYFIRMEAYQIQQIRLRENLTIQAFLNQAVQATKGKNSSKPKYEKVEELFDAESAIDEVRNHFEGRPTKRITKRDRNQIILERYEEWQKKKKERGKANGRKL